MSFRFLHTADIHLDSPLQTLALKDPEIAELIANASRETFIRLIDLCLAQQLDALLISGDLYDGDLRSMKTAAFFARQMMRLHEAGINVYILRGNHDAHSKLTRHLQLPENVHVFPGKPTSFALPEKNVVLHGISFGKPKAPDNLVVKYPVASPDAINIGLLHTSLAGSGAHDTYAPCSSQDLIELGYDYWALGHIHKRQLVAASPCTILMPGIPQGRHINEAGAKSVTVVEIAGDGKISLQEHFLAVACFERLKLDLTEQSAWSGMIEQVQQLIAARVELNRAEHLILRLELVGQTPLSARLHRDPERLAEELSLAASQSGSVHFEQIKIGTRRPGPAANSKQQSLDPLAELQAIASDSHTRQLAQEIEFAALGKELLTKLPRELRQQFDFSEPQNAPALQQIFDNGLELVLSRLESRKDTD